MRIAEVIGTVTLSRCHPALTGSRWRLIVPLGAGDLARDAMGVAAERSEPIVAYDDLGAGLRSRIAIADGAEAAAPFRPEQKPIDAYTAAILDEISIG